MAKPSRLTSQTIALIRAIASLFRAGPGETASIAAWKEIVRTHFPEVPQIKSEELAQWLADPTRVPPVLLDVRTPAEYAVSHLPGAWPFDSKASIARVRSQLPENRPIVAYCAVGWRSSTFVRRMLKRGLTNIVNLEGSIFAWANENRPLESNGQPSTKVHPYNSRVGRLLLPEHRAKV